MAADENNSFDDCGRSVGGVWQDAPVTPAVDIYALGIIWHELLLLKRPKRKISIRERRPDCPAEWEHMVEQCLEDKPEKRPELWMIDLNL